MVENTGPRSRADGRIAPLLVVFGQLFGQVFDQGPIGFPRRMV
jgi:hypothetical protein